MSKTVVRLVERDALDAIELSDELRVSLGDIAGVAREGLLALSAAAGLAVMNEMMHAEMSERIGAPKHAKAKDRNGNWHGSASGSVVLGGRRVPIERPRGRTTDGAEIDLQSYATFASDDLLQGLVVERMLARVATRRHAQVNEPVGTELAAKARSTSKSAVSRRFKVATEAALDELMHRDLRELKVAALLLDGIIFAEVCCVVALAITADGTKVPLGLWQGDTENKTVVKALLADLVGRGLSADGGLLIVIDGAKALAAAVRDVFGDLALVQRCTLHKRRNVAEHLPKAERTRIDRKLAAAFALRDVDAGIRAVRTLAAAIESQHPDAARSMLEGLDEMFTVRRLGIDGRLAATLTNTNCIESMISVGRDTTANVKRWRDGKMINRWCAAGMLNAERSFRRIKGCTQMPALVAALAAHVARVTGSCDTAKVA
jgi:transposase-like protein